MIERLLGRNIGATRFQRRKQFDFMVIVFGQRGIGMIRDRADRDVLDRVGRLLEKERRLAVRGGAALDCVSGIIAADTIDAAHLKHVGFADNRDRGRRYRENRLRASLRLGAAALCRGARQRQRARCEDGPAIDSSHGVLPALILLFDGVSRPARRAGQDSGRGQEKRPANGAGLDSGLTSVSQCLISGGSLPPFATSFTITCLWSQTFMVAESLLSPV